jgi:hypothetical protein
MKKRCIMEVKKERKWTRKRKKIGAINNFTNKRRSIRIKRRGMRFMGGKQKINLVEN